MAVILLVEDDDAILELLGDSLEAAGYRTLRCIDWAAARDLLKTETPDLAILDYMLPGRTGKYIFDQLQLSPQSKGLPVIFITGAMRIREDLPMTRRIKFMRKPIDLKMLHHHVSGLLALGRPG